jgi:serine phosphatase RsbU (regulator of sigma subunit)
MSGRVPHDFSWLRRRQRPGGPAIKKAIATMKTTTEGIGVPGRARKPAPVPQPRRLPADARVPADARLPADARVPADGWVETLTAELAAERYVVLELQRAILPLHDEPFDLPGLRVMVRYFPAEREALVGGDWYITASMPDGRVLIAIGDIAGHGLPAAAGMARLRGALAGLAITGAPPDQLVGWLNDLVHHVDEEHTASVIAGYFDPGSRVFTWAQAGHPPPVMVRGASATMLDPPDGILLGAAKLGYKSAALPLEPGDLLLLCSDGVIERRDLPLDEGLATVTAASRGARDPEQLISSVLRELGSTNPEDDSCLVAFRVT